MYLKYSITSKKHTECSFFQPELPTRWKRVRGSGKGRCLEEWFGFYAPGSDASVSGNPSGARGGFNYLSYYTPEQRERTACSGPAGKESPASISRGGWCAKRGTSAFIRVRWWVLSALQWEKKVNAKSFRASLRWFNLLKRSCLLRRGAHTSSPVLTWCTTAPYWSIRYIFNIFVLSFLASRGRLKMNDSNMRGLVVNNGVING